MFQNCATTARRAIRLSVLMATALGMTILMQPALAAEQVTLVRIQEDWELVVLEPETTTQSPQISCVTSPIGDTSGLFAVFTLNHRTLPDYSAGGLQLQVWNGDIPLANKSHSRDALLATGPETIEWTQQVRLDHGSLVFEILSGSSNTWGDFGGEGNLRASVETTLQDLNGYSSQVSKANSGISYANNRVWSLTLKRVRGYSESELVVEDNQPKVVFQHE